MTLAAVELRMQRRPVGHEVGDALGLDGETPALTTSRLLLADGEPVAVMFDVIHPRVALPDEGRLRRSLESGVMLLDVLIEIPLPIAFAHTRVIPRLLLPRERPARLLALKRTTAVLELEAVIYVTGGEAVAYSRDVFAPARLDVRVMRSLESARPAPIAPGSPRGRRRRLRAAARERAGG